jgi:hypothetical protein
VSAILLKIQNGGSAKIQNNNKLGLKLPDVSAILPKIPNGAFVYMK